MDFEVNRTIGTDHPSLPGHFPGAPIVPGVVILDEVCAVVSEWRREREISAIYLVKFLAPLKPEQQFTICLSAAKHSDTTVDFRCSVKERVIVEGRLETTWRSR
jgi:3-hydroxyacyl-[acyl-carrier-protein] dehydratase